MPCSFPGVFPAWPSHGFVGDSSLGKFAVEAHDSRYVFRRWIDVPWPNLGDCISELTRVRIKKQQKPERRPSPPGDDWDPQSFRVKGSSFEDVLPVETAQSRSKYRVGLAPGDRHLAWGTVFFSSDTSGIFVEEISRPAGPAGWGGIKVPEKWVLGLAIGLLPIFFGAFHGVTPEAGWF